MLTIHFYVDDLFPFYTSGKPAGGNKEHKKYNTRFEK